jgi:hypothetical protein
VFIEVIIVEARVRVTLRRLSDNERPEDSVCVMRNCKEINVM